MRRDWYVVLDPRDGSALLRTRDLRLAQRCACLWRCFWGREGKAVRHGA
jgi:hypothetical protein